MVLVSTTKSKVHHHDGPSRIVDERSPFSFSECLLYLHDNRLVLENVFYFFVDFWEVAFCVWCLLVLRRVLVHLLLIDFWEIILRVTFIFVFVIIIFRITATWLLLLFYAIKPTMLLGLHSFWPTKDHHYRLFRAECLVAHWIWSLLLTHIALLCVLLVLWLAAFSCCLHYFSLLLINQKILLLNLLVW